METLDYYNDPINAIRYRDFCESRGCPLAKTLLKMIHLKLGDQFKFENGFLIDLACGSGTSIVTFSKLGFGKYLGVDFAAGMLNLLPAYIAPHNLNVETAQLDLRQGIVPAPNDSADMVGCCSALMYLEDLTHVFKEASRVLKRGGLFGFNVISCNSQSEIIYNFLDCDDVTMYVHSMAILAKISNELGFHLVAGSSNIEDRPNDNPYVPGIKSHETTLLLRKK